MKESVVVITCTIILCGIVLIQTRRLEESKGEIVELKAKLQNALYARAHPSKVEISVIAEDGESRDWINLMGRDGVQVWFDGVLAGETPLSERQKKAWDEVVCPRPGKPPIQENEPAVRKPQVLLIKPGDEPWLVRPEDVPEKIPDPKKAEDFPNVYGVAYYNYSPFKQIPAAVFQYQPYAISSIYPTYSVTRDITEVQKENEAIRKLMEMLNQKRDAEEYTEIPTSHK